MRPLSEVFEEADRFFMGKSEIHAAAQRLAQALVDLEVAYAVAGGMAVNAHGHKRTTDDVDFLLTREGLTTFKRRWLGRGWVERFPGSKGIRDAVHDVKIDILLAGEYPGDGKPKPVVFPDPAEVAVQPYGGFLVLPLSALLELKLTSGMTVPHRFGDLEDVVQLVRKNGLAEDYGDQLDPYVQAKYSELWKLAQYPEEDY